MKKPVVLLILPVLFLLPSLGGFIFNRGADYNDIAISHYPNALYIQRSIAERGEIPLWSDTILGGYPFAADPLSGLHYPPGWLALLLPLPLGLNAVAVLHLLLGGAGMYLFLRSQGCARWPAIFGGLAWEALPKLQAHLGAGHLTMLYAAGWMPWLLLAQQYAGRRRAFLLLPGLLLGTILLADVRMAFIAGTLWAVFNLRMLLAGQGNPRLAAWGAQSLLTVALAGLMGAALLLPLGEFVGLSTRGLMQARDVGALSLPVARLLGLLVPEMGGTAEWAVYPGSAVLGLAMLALAFRPSRGRAFFWWLLFGLCVLWALGDQLPWFNALASLPGVSLLCVPPRMLAAGLFALIVAASLGLDTLLASPESLRSLPKFNPLLVLAGLGFFVAALSAAVWAASGEAPVRFIWGTLSLAGTLAIFFMARSGRFTSGRLACLFCGWLLFDLTSVNLISLDYRPKGEILAQGNEAAAMLLTERAMDFYRVYSPSYSIPQQTAAMLRIELADGIDPLQLKSYVDFLAKAGGFTSEGYSVTLPPFPQGDPSTDNRGARPDARLLGLLNVRYVAAEFPITAEGLEPAGQYGTTYLYTNRYERPRAWVQGAGSQPGEDILSTPMVLKTANRIDLVAEGPGLLVLSEVAYPGWAATFDGEPQPLLSVGILRGLELPEGSHRIRLEYRPTRFYLGTGVSLITLVCVGVYTISALRREHARAR